MRRLVILGGPADGSIVAEAAWAATRSGAPYELGGFLNDRIAKNEAVCGLPVLGTLDEWRVLPDDTIFIAALHKVGDMPARVDRIQNLGIPSEKWATVQHPYSQVARDVTIGRGVFIGSFVTIESRARVGDFVCVRPGAYVSHDTNLGDFAFVGSNATLTGGSTVGRGAHLAPNAVVREHLTIGDFAVVGIGAVVTRSVDPHAVVAGNPARPIEARVHRPTNRVA